MVTKIESLPGAGDPAFRRYRRYRQPAMKKDVFAGKSPAVKPAGQKPVFFWPLKN